MLRLYTIVEKTNYSSMQFIGLRDNHIFDGLVVSETVGRRSTATSLHFLNQSTSKKPRTICKILSEAFPSPKGLIAFAIVS